MPKPLHGGFGHADWLYLIAESAMVMRGASPPPQMRFNLNRNVRHMRSGLLTLGIDVADTLVPIVTIRGKVDLELLRSELAARDIIVKFTPAPGFSAAPDVPARRLDVFSQHCPEQTAGLSSMAEFF